MKVEQRYYDILDRLISLDPVVRNRAYMSEILFTADDKVVENVKLAVKDKYPKIYKKLTAKYSRTK